MALRHRHKKRSWHWMRREVGFWNSSLGTYGRLFDEMAKAHQRAMDNALRDILLSPGYGAFHSPRYGTSIFGKVFNWQPLIIEPKRPKELDICWLEESADIKFEDYEKLIGKETGK